jgi:hypothetical protein
MQKVRATPEWKKFMDEGAFNQTFMTGAEFAKWVANEEIRHRLLMQEAGFVANRRCAQPPGPQGAGARISHAPRDKSRQPPLHCHDTTRSG